MKRTSISVMFLDQAKQHLSLLQNHGLSSLDQRFQFSELNKMNTTQVKKWNIFNTLESYPEPPSSHFSLPPLKVTTTFSLACF